MSTWLNDDGLFIKFGVTEGEQKRVGEVNNGNFNREVVWDIDYSDLGATGTETIASDTVVIPANAIIQSATLFVDTAFTSGGSATLTLGLIQQDRSTAIDADGIDATVAVAALTAGASIACDGALVGAGIGSNNGYLTSTVGTAAFTAGKARLVIEYHMPMSTQS